MSMKPELAQTLLDRLLVEKIVTRYSSYRCQICHVIESDEARIVLHVLEKHRKVKEARTVEASLSAAK